MRVVRARESTTDRSRRKDREWAERHRLKWMRTHVGANPPPRTPRPVWIDAQLITADEHGRYCRHLLRRIAEKNARAAGAVRCAALAPLADGTTRYTWAGRDDSARRARRILAIFWTRWCASQATARHDGARLVRGQSVSFLRAAIRDETTGRKPSPSAMSGTHRRGATLATGQIGYLRALEEAGACWTQQFKTGETIKKHCESWEIGPDGYPIAWVWIPGPVTAHLSIEEIRAAEPTHELGLRAADEVITRRVSYVRAIVEPEPDPPS